jgi:Flp pilus assembly protein TadD
MSSKYSFLRTKVSFVIVGLIVGLFAGFKISNSQYRREQSRAVELAAARGAATVRDGSGRHATAEIQAILDRARAAPNDADAQMEAASQFIQIEQPDSAMPYLEQADRARPNDLRIAAGIGVAHFMRGDFERAAGMLKKSRDLGATELTVTSLLIGAYIEMRKNLDEADRLLRELETKGVDPAKTAQIRADLNAARAGNVGGSKSVLDHGPENKVGK